MTVKKLLKKFDPWEEEVAFVVILDSNSNSLRWRWNVIIDDKKYPPVDIRHEKVKKFYIYKEALYIETK